MCKCLSVAMMTKICIMPIIDILSCHFHTCTVRVRKSILIVMLTVHLYRCRDPLLQMWPMVVKYHFFHNHPLRSAAVLGKNAVNEATRRRLIELFKVYFSLHFGFHNDGNSYFLFTCFYFPFQSSILFRGDKCKLVQQIIYYDS